MAASLVIDVDATLIAEGPDDKDGTGEALVGMLRPGNHTANIAADNIAVIDQAIAQRPVLADEVDLMVRGDRALATHDVVDHLVDLGVGFSVSYDLIDAVRDAIFRCRGRPRPVAARPSSGRQPP